MQPDNTLSPIPPEHLHPQAPQYPLALPGVSLLNSVVNGYFQYQNLAVRKREFAELNAQRGRHHEEGLNQRERHLRSAGFLVCCIAGFQTGGAWICEGQSNVYQRKAHAWHTGLEICAARFMGRADVNFHSNEHSEEPFRKLKRRERRAPV